MGELFDRQNESPVGAARRREFGPGRASRSGYFKRPGNAAISLLAYRLVTRTFRNACSGLARN